MPRCPRPGCRRQQRSRRAGLALSPVRMPLAPWRSRRQRRLPAHRSVRSGRRRGHRSQHRGRGRLRPVPPAPPGGRPGVPPGSPSRTRPRPLWPRGRRPAPGSLDPAPATTSPGLVSGIVTPQRIPAPSGLNKVATSGLRSPATRNTIESGARY